MNLRQYNYGALHRFIIAFPQRPQVTDLKGMVNTDAAAVMYDLLSPILQVKPQKC